LPFAVTENLLAEALCVLTFPIFNTPFLMLGIWIVPTIVLLFVISRVELLCFDRGNNHAHESTVQNRLLVDASELCAGSLELVKHLSSDIHVAHFAPLELHHHANLVSVGKKTQCVLYLGFKIVRVDAAGKLNFLELNGLLLLLGFLFALIAFKAEFTVVHDLAYGRSCLRCHHNQIQAFVISQLQCLGRAHDSHGFTVGSDQTDLFRGDLLVEQVFFVFCANSSTPPSEKNTVQRQTLRTATPFPSVWKKKCINQRHNGCVGENRTVCFVLPVYYTRPPPVCQGLFEKKFLFFSFFIPFFYYDIDVHGKEAQKVLPKHGKILTHRFLHKNFCRFSSYLMIYKSTVLVYNIPC